MVSADDDEDSDEPTESMEEPSAPPAADRIETAAPAGAGRAEESAEHLMARFKRGEVRAFALIVARFKRPMVAFLFRMTGDRHWAEDLAQDVFVRVFSAAATYKDGRAFTPWLYAIARNIAIDFLRRAWRRGDAPAASADEPSDPADPEALALVREREAAVREAIAALPEIYREAVVLCDMQGLSYKDAAEAMDTTVKTVSSRLARGRAQLAERLRPMLVGKDRRQG